MFDAPRRFLGLVRRDGPRTAAARVLARVFRRLYYAAEPEPLRIHNRAVRHVLAEDDINICHNGTTRQDYDPAMTNVLVCTEGPDLVEAEDWLDPSFDFHAEFSYGDFYGLDRFHSLRRLHATHDAWVQPESPLPEEEKTELASIVYADKRRFRGRQLRHQVGDEHEGVVDTYGSAVGDYLYEKRRALDPYMFHVAIESGRHPEYVTEKFFDPIKTGTVPIYWGGREAVEAMGFDTEGILFFEDMEEFERLLDERVTREEYERLRPHVEANRQRLIEIRNEIRQDALLDAVRHGYLAECDDRRSGELSQRYQLE